MSLKGRLSAFGLGAIVFLGVSAIVGIVAGSLTVYASGGAAVVTMGSAQGNAGADVSIPISLTTGGTHPTVISFELVFDSTKLAFKSMTAGASVTNAGKTVDANLPSAGDLRIVILGGLGVMGDGLLGTAVFTILEADNASTPLHGTGLSISDDADPPNAIPGSIVDGAITGVCPVPVILQGPDISAITATSAAIEWETNDPADSVVRYGLTSAVDLDATDATLTTVHRVVLTGLAATTSYYVQVVSKETACASAAASPILSFQTTNLSEPPPPVITAGPLAIQVSDTSAMIAWSTDEPSTSGVAYNDGAPHDIEDGSLVREHLVRLTGLAAGTTYNCTISSKSVFQKVLREVGPISLIGPKPVGSNGPIREIGPTGSPVTTAAGNGPTRPCTFTTGAAADTTAPEIVEGPLAIGGTDTALTIRWVTDEPSDSVVDFGTTELDQTVSSADLTRVHVVMLVKLQADTKYQIRASSTDAANNGLASSATFTARTAAAPDVTGPVFTSGPSVVGQTDTTATVYWRTDEPADSVVTYNQASGPSIRASNPAKVTEHYITLTNLMPGATYSYTVSSMDSSGNITVSSGGAKAAPETPLTFTTNAAPDVAPPVIIAGPTVTGISDTMAAIHWTTDEPADSRVNYGLSGGDPTDFAADIALVTDHVIVLTGLTPNSGYSTTVASVDSSGNGPTTSAPITFTTSGTPDTTPPVFNSGPAPSVIGKTSAVISWDTDESATSQVFYGLTAASMHDTATVTGLSQEHDVAVTNLLPNTTYSYVASSLDISGNEALSAVKQFTTAPPDVTVPDLSGKTQDEAQTLLTGAGLVVGTITHQYDSVIAKDTIISQSPAANSSAPLGSAVNFTISDGPPPMLSVTPLSQEVGAAGGDTAFTVANTGSGTLNWSAVVAQGDSAWLSIPSSATGINTGTLTARCAANTTTSQRAGTITVSAPGAQRAPLTVTVTQAGLPRLSVTPSNQHVGVAGGNTTFTVANTGRGTMSWTATVATTDTWLSILSGTTGTNGGVITATCAANPDQSRRVGTITIAAPGALGDPVAVTVTQAGTLPSLSVTPPNQNVAASGGDVTFAVANEGSGTLNWSAVVESDDTAWLSIASGATGVNTGTLTARCAANTTTNRRVGRITVSATNPQGSPVTVTVTQLGVPLLSVTPTNRDVGAGGGDAIFAVANSGSGTLNWSAVVASADTAWLSIPSSATGVNTGTLTARCAANTTTSRRVGTIRISATNAQGSPMTVTVTQVGIPLLSITPDTAHVDAEGGAITFTVANKGSGTMNWTAAVAQDAPWLSIMSGPSGIDSGKITVTCTANTTTSDRTGVITVSAPGAQAPSVTVSVVQYGEPVLSVTPSNQEVGAAGGATTFTVSNAGSDMMSWTASVAFTDAWLSISSGTFGVNSGAITATFAANGTTAARTGTITVSAPGAQGSPVTLTVTQTGVPVLSVTPLNRSMGAAGGDATFSVANTGSGTLNWSAAVAQKDAVWLLIKAGKDGTNNGTITATCVANATTSARTGTIIVSSPGAQSAPATLTVTQNGLPVLSVTPAIQRVGAAAGNVSFTVGNNGSGPMTWTASVAAADTWLTISSGTSGTDAGTITAAYAANATTSTRTGTITVSAADAQVKPVQVTVTQAGIPLLSVTPTNQDVDSLAGSTTFTVENKGVGTMNWTAKVSETDNWLSVVSGKAGTNGGTITATFPTNPGDIQRVGTITVSAVGAQGSPVKVTVTQPTIPVMTVPDVVGKVLSAARDAIVAAGLVVGVIAQEQSPTVPVGEVIAQDPLANVSVRKGSAVDLEVSAGPAPILMPVVTGMTLDSAQTAIANAGLAVGTVTQQSDPAVPAGQVISQYPPAKTPMAPGSTVDLVVSTGPSQARIPEVVGKPLADAQAAIVAAGLTVGTTTREYDASPVDIVIRQSPSAGVVPLGTQVDLVVSDGPPPATVPDLVGKTAADALAALTALGLKVGTETLTYSDTVSEGLVISQSPAAGVSAMAGDTVDLVISEGPAVTTGSLTVAIEPEAARTAGAQWQVDGGDWHSSGDTVSGLGAGPHVVTFSDIANQGGIFGCVSANTWVTPDNQTVNVAANQAATATGTYAQSTVSAAGAGTKSGGDWALAALLASGLLLGVKSEKVKRKD